MSGEQEDDENSQDAMADIQSKFAIVSAMKQYIDGCAVLCGEGYFTHEEHQKAIDILEDGAARVLAKNWGLTDIPGWNEEP